MIHFVIVCFLGVVSGVPLFRDEAFTPSPPGMKPPCATKSATFCEKVDKYPTKIIQSILQTKSFMIEDLFVDEREGLQEPPEYILHEDMMVVTPPNKTCHDRKSRSADPGPSLTELSKRCPILSKVTFPKLATNGAGEWRYIVQDNLSNVSQKIKVHICDESAECKTYCMQFYAPVSLVSLTHNNTVAKDTFWMPSSCRCLREPINTL